MVMLEVEEVPDCRALPRALRVYTYILLSREVPSTRI